MNSACTCACCEASARSSEFGPPLEEKTGPPPSLGLPPLGPPLPLDLARAMNSACTCACCEASARSSEFGLPLEEKTGPPPSLCPPSLCPPPPLGPPSPTLRVSSRPLNSACTCACCKASARSSEFGLPLEEKTGPPPSLGPPPSPILQFSYRPLDSACTCDCCETSAR